MAHPDYCAVKGGFAAASNRFPGDKERILTDCRLMQNTPTDCESISRQIAEPEQIIEVVTELTEHFIAENAQAALIRAECNIRHNGPAQRYSTATAGPESLPKTGREIKAETIGGFIFRVQ